MQCGRTTALHVDDVAPSAVVAADTFTDAPPAYDFFETVTPSAARQPVDDRDQIPQFGLCRADRLGGPPPRVPMCGLGYVDEVLVRGRTR